MISSARPALRPWQLALVAAPFLLFLAADALGVMSLLRLAIAGSIAAAGLACLLVVPRWGVYFMAFYTYSGITNFLPNIVGMGVVLTLTGATALDLIRGAPWRLRTNAFLWCVAIFAVMGLQSIVWAHHPEASVAGLVELAKSFLLVVLTVHWVRTRQHLKTLTLSVAGGAVATLVIGWLALSMGVDSNVNLTGSGDTFVLRFSGAHADPNYAAAYMTGAIPIAVYLSRFARGWTLRILGLVLAAALVVGVFLTFSRSALFPLGIVAAMLIGRELTSPRAYALVGGLAGVAALFTPSYYWTRFSTVVDAVNGSGLVDYSIGLRIKAAKVAWQLFLENPLTGIGLENFAQRSAFALQKRIVAHNTYLDLLAGVGAIATAVWLGIFLSVQTALTQIVRDPTLDPERRGLAFYIITCIVSGLISALFLSIQLKYLLWFSLGLGLAVVEVTRDEQGATPA